MLYSEGLEPFIKFFVDQNLTLVMTLLTGWKDTVLP